MACFRELDDDEFEERWRRREEKKRRGSSRLGWPSFWSSGRKQRGNDDEMEEDDDDCLLWELDNDSIEDDGRSSGNSSGSSSTDNNGDSISYQEAAACIDGNNIQIQQQSQTTTPKGTKNENDDVIESGESVFSIHHRTEKEKMKQFYSNGFRFDSNNAGDACHNGHVSGSSSSNDTNEQQQQRNANNNNNKMEGPYYNDNGERIIGCIVGSFLPSTMPSKQHVSSLDTKLGRDETASLLIPDPHRHTKMFYIMTLGTSAEFRRCGLGSLLVNRVVDVIVREREDCGALYLHVITYNEGAIRLYERLGFSKVKVIKGERERGEGLLYYFLCVTNDSLWASFNSLTHPSLQIITPSTLSITNATFMHATFTVSPLQI